MKRLGIDVDGVVANFVEGFYKLGHELFDIQKSGPQATWDFEDVFTREQYNLLWEHLKAQKDWWQSLRPLPGTSKLRGLPSRVEPIFITSRVPTRGHSTHDQTCAWLRQHFYISYPSVIVVDRPAEKVALCKNLGIDNFIDDKRSTIEDMHKAGLRSYAQLAPYNSGEPFPEGVIPVENLNEFLEAEIG